MKNILRSLLAVSLAISANAATGPKLQFQTNAIDFGSVTAGEIVNRTFVFTNNGDETLIISSVQPGCGCTTAGEWTKHVEPGNTGTIPLTFNSKAFDGPVTKTIIVQCNARSNETVTLLLRGTIHREIIITPDIARLLLYPNSVSASATVHVTNSGVQLLELYEPTISSSKSNFFTLTMKTNIPGREYEVTIVTEPRQTFKLDYGKLTIHTSLSNQPTISTAFMVAPSPWFRIEPAHIMVPAGSTNKVVSNITVVNNAPYHVFLSNPRCSDPSIPVTLGTERTGEVYNLRATIPTNYHNNEPLTVTVDTSNTNQPSISVPFKNH
jgi:Protein of unknown function (DUF1573)